MKFRLILACAVIVLAAALLLGGFMYFRADKIGVQVGESSGKTVGWAIGSFKGFTEGKSRGEEDGNAAGLSAADTVAEAVNRIESIGRLEVLVSGVKLTNDHSIGTAYSALYLMKGSAVYSVDLMKASVTFSADGKKVTIGLPEPEVELYVDENETRKLAEYQRHSYTGNSKDGFDAYLNTVKITVKEARETIANYDELMAIAKEAAVTQITRLAGAVCGEGTFVQVSFADAEGAL